MATHVGSNKPETYKREAYRQTAAAALAAKKCGGTIIENTEYSETVKNRKI